MYRRTISAVALAACAALVSMTTMPATASHGAPTATASTSTSAHAPSDISPGGKKGECYVNPPPGPGRIRDDIALISDNFSDPGFAIYDSAGAADFENCPSVSSVDTSGVYFNGSGPADSVDVLFYKLKGTLPGKLIKQYLALGYTDSGFGSLSVTIPKTKTKKGAWVSVVANLDFSSGGEWGWNLTATQQEYSDAWQNPGGGMGTGCPSWNTVWTCLGELGDWVVTLHK